MLNIYYIIVAFWLKYSLFNPYYSSGRYYWLNISGVRLQNRLNESVYVSICRCHQDCHRFRNRYCKYVGSFNEQLSNCYLQYCSPVLRYCSTCVFRGPTNFHSDVCSPGFQPRLPQIRISCTCATLIAIELKVYKIK